MASIKIAAKDVDSFGIAQHLYIIYTDSTGIERVLRGGPENSNLTGALMGNIQVVDQRHEDSLDRDPNNVHTKQEIWTGTDAELASKIAAAQAMANQINAGDYDYNLPLVETVLPSWPINDNQNSNTVANYLAGAMGLSTEVRDFVDANNLNVPGIDATLGHDPVERTVNALSDAIKDAGLSLSGFVDGMAGLMDDTVDNVVAGAQDLLADLWPDFPGGDKGTTWGDPHIITYDGVKYDFQAPGEFVLTASKDDDFQVQVRQQLKDGSKSISLNKAVSTYLNGTRMGLYVIPQIEGWLQGTPGDDTLQAGGDTKLLLGAEDSGKAQITSGGDVTIFQARCDVYKNTFGYYLADENGNPTYGNVIWANARTAPTPI